MRLTELEIKNFRNYSNQKFTFQAPIILFYGDNAQGKTNLLEAIFYLATGKSHRANKEEELIRWEASGFYLKGELERNSAEYALEVITNYQNGKNKRLKVNELTQSGKRNFLNMMNVVMFSPEDLMLVKGTPENRRRFMDQEITQINPSYDSFLKSYYKALKQRNRLLKIYQDRALLETYLAPWNEQLAYHGARIMVKRKQIIHRIKLLARLLYRKITNQKETLELNYLPTLKVVEQASEDKLSISQVYEQFSNLLQESLEEDINKRTTTLGPHRDDLSFKINDKEARIYGSQGQQRTTVLALKMAELEMIKGEKGEFPILLLDDVLSELDSDRKRHLLNLTEGKVQTFVTSTSRDDFNEDMKSMSQIYFIDNGRAVTENAKYEI